MSREAVVEFLGRVRTDAEIRSAIDANPTAAAYVETGAALGWSFSAAELRAVMNAERFYDRAAREPALSARLTNAAGEAAVVSLARGEGFPCQLEDLQVVLKAYGANELGDAELDHVAGGARRSSIPDVCKTPTPGGPVPLPYPNFG